MMQKNNNIVNITNFIRAVEPREKIDLFEPMREQMALACKYHLPTTWLLQYDALVEGPFVDFLLREMPADHEVGIWFEVVQQNVEAAGLQWRGRYSWDWHTNVGFSVGYTPKERERIADCFVEEFIRRFGYPPVSMGSWLFDAHLLNYLHEKWGIASACNCRDQYGTDGYTLWGGYWANGYYPCRNNAYLPASNAAAQIPVPVFRMLGSDPLYQYDAGIGSNGQAVITLEPAYPDLGGGSGEWVEWFLKENFREPHFAMAYAQAGQENSFGWPRMAAGLNRQYREIARMRDAGEIRVETLGETGRWFRKTFPVTPVSAVVTLEDWKHENHAGIWYLSRLGRMNLFRNERRELLIRDWQLFCDDYPEPFLRTVCTTRDCVYDALPLVDGMLWHPSSIRFPGGPGGIADVREIDPEKMELVWQSDSGALTVITLSPESIHIVFPTADATLNFVLDIDRARRFRTAVEFDDGEIIYHHKGKRYKLIATTGKIIPGIDGYVFAADKGRLKLEFVHLQ